MPDPENHTFGAAAGADGRVFGTIAPGFEGVRDAFAEAQATDDGGAQLFVYRHGQPVVNLWAGRDKLSDRPYTNDTISVLMSCTKGALATCINILAERGQIDFDVPVAAYWPGFERAGKESVLVRHVLSHSAGLMGFEPESGIGAAELFDGERCVAAMEAMAPLWPPGTATLYHVMTIGVVIGEVIRRVSGKSMGRFFADEVAGPLGLDLWIGLPEAEEYRRAPHFSVGPRVVADQWRAGLAQRGVDLDSRLVRTTLHTLATSDEAIELINTSRAARVAELPAANGVGDARSLARMYAALIGKVDGVRLIQPETMEKARAPQLAGIGAPAELAAPPAGDKQDSGLGYSLPWSGVPMLGPGSFGFSGAGGRLGFAHPELGIAVGYVCNAMLYPPIGPDPRWIGWTQALHEAL
jgi:CubicO group peptidase (beta-lactamase class C family)